MDANEIKRQNLNHQIEICDANIACFQQMRQRFVDALKTGWEPPTDVKTVDNNAFVSEYRVCNCCFGNFEFGDSEHHYYDQNELGVCEDCAKGNKPQLY
jgi:hypothetical protein